jgi:serine/threonine protein kinase
MPELPGDEEAARIGAAVLEALRRGDQQQLALSIGRAVLTAGLPQALTMAAFAAPAPAPAPAAPVPPPSIPAPAAATPSAIGLPTLPPLPPSEPPLLMLPSAPPDEAPMPARPPPSGPPPTPATEVVGDRFQIVTANGGDRRGRIFIGRDRNDGAEVTIRLFSLRMGHDAAALERLQGRVARCRELSHPHLERLLAAGQHNGELYSVAENVRGRPLSDLLSNGPMPEPQALRLMLQSARALQHAWDLGRVVHGDLDADLLVVRSGGSEPAAVVTGFGMPRTPWDDQTRIGPLTVPWYVAPERLRGDADEDPCSDMYALGAILYHLLAGAPPYQGGAAEVRAGHLGPVVPDVGRRRGGISPATVQLLNAALGKTPGQRYASYSGFISAITKALVGIGGFSADLVEPGGRSGTSRTYRKRDTQQQDALLAPTGTDRFRKDPATTSGASVSGTAPGTDRLRKDAQGRPVTSTSGLIPQRPAGSGQTDRIVRPVQPGQSMPGQPGIPAQNPADPAIRPATTRLGRMSSAQWQPGQSQLPPHALQGETRARTDRLVRTDRVAKDAPAGGGDVRVTTSDALQPRAPGTTRLQRDGGGPPAPAPTIANPYPADGGIMSSRIVRRQPAANAKLLTPVPGTMTVPTPAPPAGATPAPTATAEPAPAPTAVATLPTPVPAPAPAEITPAAASSQPAARRGSDDDARPSTDAVPQKLGDPALDRRDGRRPIPPATVYTPPPTLLSRVLLWAPVIALILCVILLVIITVISAQKG